MRLGVFHAGALGDCVLTLHVVRAIASAMAEEHAEPTHVCLIARTPAARLAAGRSVVNSAVDLDGRGMSGLFATTAGAVVEPDVRHLVRGFDRIVSFCGTADVPPATRLREAAACPVLAVDPRVRPETEAARRHITAQWIEDLRTAGRVPIPVGRLRCDAGILPAPPGGPEACTPTRESGPLETAQAAPEPTTEPLIRVDAAKRRGVILHLGSGGKAKCWPLERFEAVASELRRAGRDVRWMIGPVELDWYGEAFRTRLARTADVIYEEDLARAAAAIAGADAFVGNDAGMTHLAAALGTPTVALFGPTDPAVWRPIGPAVRTIGGPRTAGEPFDDIAVDDVVSVLTGMSDRDRGLRGLS